MIIDRSSTFVALALVICTVDSVMGVPMASQHRPKRQQDVEIPIGGTPESITSASTSATVSETGNSSSIATASGNFSSTTEAVPPTPVVTEDGNITEMSTLSNFTLETTSLAASSLDSVSLSSTTLLSISETSTIGNLSSEATASGSPSNESISTVAPELNSTESMSTAAAASTESVSTAAPDLNATELISSSMAPELNATGPISTMVSELNATEFSSSTIAPELNGTESISTMLPELNSTESASSSMVPELNATEPISTIAPEINATESIVMTTFSNLLSSILSTFGSSNETTVSVIADSSMATENATLVSTVSELVTGVSLEANTTVLSESTESMSSQLSNTTVEDTTAVSGSLETTASTEASNTTIFLSESTLSGNESTQLSESTIASMTTSMAESTIRPINASEVFTIPPFVEVMAGRRVNTSTFDCSKRQAGLYGNPREACDAKFYICVDPLVLAYEQPCVGHLYFDDDLKVCESWVHIPACSGKTRPAPKNDTTQPPRNETLSTAAPVVKCANQTDGYYPDPIGTIKPNCSNRFYICIGGLMMEDRCPFNLIYDHELHRCEREQHVFACTGERSNETVSTRTPAPTLPPVDFECKGLPDGYFVNNCSNTFYSCNGGQARELHCPHGLVYDTDSKMCDIPSNVFICTGTNRTTKVIATTESVNISSTPESPMDCVGKPDGIYPDPLAKCSREFYFCAHNVSSRTQCPANLYYDAKFKRCDLWLNVFDCSGLHPTSPPKTTPSSPPTFPAVSFDCLKREDGNYPNPEKKCSQFYYQCANMEAFKQDCAADLFYDATRDMCDSWIRVVACSGITIPPSTPSKEPQNFTEPSTKKPAFDCSKKPDGSYADPAKNCSSIFYECSGGHEYEMRCQDGLYFDLEADQCDNFENVLACSGVSRAPKPSTASMQPKSTKPKPDEASIDCMFLADGDYEDPKNNCSNTYYSCSGGYAFKRNCPDKTFFDADRDQCDRFYNVFACSGRKLETTRAGPSTKQTPRPKYPFDCTKKYDGFYAAGDCVQEYWSCVGGLTFPHQCLFGLVYDEERNECEFPFLVPKCGGHRITPAPKHGSTSKKPVVFDCTFLADGNYPDPQAKDNCSSIFYSCSSGITSPLRCPDELIFDPTMNSCDRRGDVAACSGSTEIVTKSTSTAAGRTVMLINDTTGIGEISTSAPVSILETTTASVNESTTAPSNETTVLSSESTTATGMAGNETTAAEMTTTIGVESSTIAVTGEFSTVQLNETETAGPMNATSTVSPVSESSIGSELVNASETSFAVEPSTQLSNSSETAGPINETSAASVSALFETTLGSETVTSPSEMNATSSLPIGDSSSTGTALISGNMTSVAGSESSLAPLNETTLISAETSSTPMNETTIAPSTMIGENATSILDASTSALPSNGSDSTALLSSEATSLAPLNETASSPAETSLAPMNETTAVIGGNATSIIESSTSALPSNVSESTSLLSSVATSLAPLNDTASVPAETSSAPLNETTIPPTTMIGGNASSVIEASSSALPSNASESSALPSSVATSLAPLNETASVPAETSLASLNETTVAPTTMNGATGANSTADLSTSPASVSELTSSSVGFTESAATSTALPPTTS